MMNPPEEQEKYRLILDAEELRLQGTSAKIHGRHNEGISILREALSKIERVLALDPNIGWAWYTKGIILSDMERFVEACDAYARAVQINPLDEAARSNLEDTMRRHRIRRR